MPEFPSLPFVSVIMPVRNEANYIQRSLEAVLAQNYPSECLQIIIADGMSSDNTCQIIQSYQEDYPHLALIDNPGKIVPTGLNAAIRHAQGDIIIRVDGHCEIDNNYIFNCVRHIQTKNADGVGGSVTTIGETNLAKAIATAMSSPFGVGNSAFRTAKGKTMMADSVPFPAYTRSVFNRAGLYDEELIRNQDDEYNYRLRKLGSKILLAADVHSKYYSRSSLGSLWRQYFQYGFWKVRVLQKHPRQMRPRQFIPLIFVALLISTGLLSVFNSAGTYLLALAAGVYLLANLAASAWTAYKQGRQYLLLLPMIYAILHISYGLGFLIGLFRFSHRWGDQVGKVPLLPTNS
ncbi:glycosyltransferase family 2 protein [Chloroflexota bacterium]